MSRKHRPPASDRTAQLFCDLDLSILGASPSDYAHYAKNIRREYPDFSDWVFGWFRRRFLIKSKKRRSLFQVLKSREKQARENLKSELSGSASLSTIRKQLLKWVTENKLRHTTILLLWLSLPLVFVFLGLLFYPYSILVPAVWLVNRLRWRYAEARARSGDLLFLDEPQRRGLWQALSELYLDQNVQIPELASLLHASGYSAEEIRVSLREEVGPALTRNLGFGVYPVTGEWAALDPDRLRTEILVHTARGGLAPTRWLRGLLSTWYVRRNLERALAYS